MSSVSSMLPMLLVIGLAVVAFVKRCDFLPELCNPSQAQGATLQSYLPAPTWEDYVKAGKERKKDDDRDEETLKVADKIAEINAARRPVSKFARVSYF